MGSFQTSVDLHIKKKLYYYKVSGFSPLIPYIDDLIELL